MLIFAWEKSSEATRGFDSKWGCGVCRSPHYTQIPYLEPGNYSSAKPHSVIATLQINEMSEVRLSNDAVIGNIVCTIYLC